MRLSFAIVIALLACGVTGASAKPRPNCLAGLTETLQSGKFSGSLDCTRDQLSLRMVGKLRASGHQFAIYDYHYVLDGHCADCSRHGGQRIVVLRDGRYVGQYKPSTPPFTRVQVVGANLLLQSNDEALPPEERRAVRIDFDRSGPPRYVHIGGEDLDFFR